MSDDIHDTVETHSRMYRELLLGFVRVHVLHRANQGATYGTGFSAELKRYGYRVSVGTLNQMLHNLANDGFLAREDHVVNGRHRKYYTITPLGRRALVEAQKKALQLVNEITDDDHVSRP